MNKTFILVSFAVASFLLSSCSDNILATDVPLEQNGENATGYERLSFDSSDALLDAIEKGGDGNISTRQSGFISLLSSCSLTRGEENDDNYNYYEALGYDSLIPNVNFAKLLNPDGECIVNDTVYKINRNGTYFYHKKRDSEFKEIVQKDSLGTLVQGDLYCLSTGIYRYNTFKSSSVEEIDCPDGQADDWDDEMDNSINTRSYIPEPNWNNFPIFSADRHTFFGKLWQGVVGNDKYYDVKLSKKRKVRGRLYAYHYVAYAESGVTGMMEKKNWIGWSKTAADELRIGWKNIVLTIDVKDYSMDGMPQTPNELNGAGIHNMRLPNGDVEKTLLLYNKDLKPFARDRYLAMGVPALVKLAKSMLGSGHVTEWDKIKNVIIATRGKIYIMESDEMRQSFNIKSMTHIIAKRFNIMITLNFNQLPSNLVGWVNTLKGTLEQEYPKLVSGEAYICGRLGNTWQGMKIRK